MYIVRTSFLFSDDDVKSMLLRQPLDQQFVRQAVAKKTRNKRKDFVDILRGSQNFNDVQTI